MLTIDEIKNISFRKATLNGGYRAEDVDSFIDEVIVSFEQLKKEKTNLVHKIDVLATRVEQYRADEETVRNALLASQKVADACIREAMEKAAMIVRDAETKAQTLLVDANNMTAAEKEHYLLYSKHIKSIDDLPSTSDVEASKAELDEKYPTEEVTAPAQPQVEDDVKIAVPSEMKAEPIAETEEVSAHPKRQSKFSHLKFGDNYDVTAD